MQFSRIPGYQELKKTLVSSFGRNHTAHAQLFYGQKGGAALPLAISYGTYLLCENKGEADSCGECSNCQKMAKYIHPDVHFFFPGSKSQKDKERTDLMQSWRNFIQNHPFGDLEDLFQSVGSENKLNQIGKDDAREIIKTVSLKSFEGGLKIIFIWCPELLNSSAANAILKVLEEPPENTLYLLVSHDYESIIPTIISRTQLFSIPPFETDVITNHLQNHYNIEREKAEHLSRLSENSLGEALKLMENPNEMTFQSFQNWMQCNYKQDHGTLVKLAEDFSKSSKSEQRSLLSYGITLIRNAILAKDSDDLLTVSGAEKEFVVKFGKTLPNETLESIYLEMNEVLWNLSRNANPKISFLSLSLRISELIHTPKKV